MLQMKRHQLKLKENEGGYVLHYKITRDNIYGWRRNVYNVQFEPLNVVACNMCFEKLCFFVAIMEKSVNNKIKG